MDGLVFFIFILIFIVVSYLYTLITVSVLKKRMEILNKTQVLTLEEIREIKRSLLNDSMEEKLESVAEVIVPELEPIAVVCTKKVESTASKVVESISPIPSVVKEVKPEIPVEQKSQKETPAVPKEPGKVKQVFIDIKDWLLVGDKYRAVGVSKEYAIASNWLARLGIMILVLGMAFALRYSYKHGLVSHQVRVIASLITGVLMVFFGLKQNGKKYELLGHGLLGGGITTLYFSVFSATNLYHLISPTFGMSAMVLVTITCGVLSVKFNSKLVAILGILGGYLTPVLLSTGSINLGALYCYLLLIGLGVLGITLYRSWYLIRSLGFVCHWLIVTGALITVYLNSTEFSFALVIPLLILFFLLFSFNTCFYQIKKRIHSTILEIVGLFLNSTIFTIVTTFLVIDRFDNDSRYGAIVMIGLAIFYIGCSNVILRLKHRDRGLVLTFLAFSGFYTAMALPFLFSAGWLTVSWSLQALIMLWLSRKLNNRFLQSTAYLVYMVTFFSLISTFKTLYQPSFIGVNEMVFTDLVRSIFSHLLQIGIPVVSFFLGKKMIVADIKSSALATESINDMPEKLLLNKSLVTQLFQIIFVIFIFLFSLIEVSRFFTNVYKPMLTPAINLVVVFLATYLLVQVRKSTVPHILTLLNVLLGLLVVKILCFDAILAWSLSRRMVYGSFYSLEDGIMRLLSFTMLTAILTYLTKLQNPKGSAFDLISKFFSFVVLMVPLVFLTLEVKSIMNELVPEFQVGVVSLVWASYAVTMLTIGVVKSKRSLRYLALTLFTVTTLKVFFVDLEKLDEFWRIIAFMVLGVIIFFGSFIYIRYQHLFSATQEKVSDED